MNRFFRFFKAFLKYIGIVSWVILLIVAYLAIIYFFAELQCYYFGFKDKFGVSLVNFIFISILILISLIAWEKTK